MCGSPAIAICGRALATAGEEVVLQGQANYYLGVAYQAQGDYRQAIDCLRQTVASLEGARRRERFDQFFLHAVSSRAHLATYHVELGMFAEGSALGEEGLRIAEAVDHPASMMYACWGIGLLALRQGDLPTALPRLERVMGLCQDKEAPHFALQDEEHLLHLVGGRQKELLTKSRRNTTLRAPRQGSS
jgi:hypothetical protein